MTVKRISQQTFNEVVKENMDEFDMPVEEAIEDAKNQFDTQGVDLSALVLSIEGLGMTADSNDPMKSMHPLVNAITAVTEFLDTTNPDDDDDDSSSMEVVESSLLVLQQACTKKPNPTDNEDATKMRKLIASHGGIECSLRCSLHPRLSRMGLHLLLLLCSGSDVRSHREFVYREHGLPTLLQMMKKSKSRNHHSSPALLHWKLIKSICQGHEGNKKHFREAQGLEMLFHDIKMTEDQDLQSELMKVLRTLTMNDDREAQMSQVHDVVKELSVEYNIIELVFQWIEPSIEEQKKDLTFLSLVLQVLKNLCITQDHCQAVVDRGMLSRVKTWLCELSQISVVMNSSLGLLRNLSAADDHKPEIVRLEIITRVTHVMLLHTRDPTIQEQACAVVANVALRQGHERCHHMIVDARVVQAISLAMSNHSGNPRLLRQATLALRNLVARHPTLRSLVLEQDEALESKIQACLGMRGCGDEAYAALRDLGCAIQLYSSAGQTKANFNPTTVQSRDLLRHVSANAQAPFAQ